MSFDETSDEGEMLNPRAERSKQALVTAMTIALDRHEPGQLLSIAEISRAAGVSRPTLYQHFGDLPNLIRAAAAVRLVALFESVPPQGFDSPVSWQDLVAALHALLTELEHRRGFYLAVLDSTAAGEVREDVIEFLAPRIVDVTALGPVMQNVEPSAEDVHERAMFLAAGALWRTERWLREDVPESAEDLAHRLSRILASAAGIRDA